MDICQTSFFIIIKRKRKKFSQEIRFRKKAIWSRQCSALAINAIVIYSTLNNHSVWETSYSLKKNFKEKSHSTLYSDKFPVFFYRQHVVLLLVKAWMKLMWVDMRRGEWKEELWMHAFFRWRQVHEISPQQCFFCCLEGHNMDEQICLPCGDFLRISSLKRYLTTPLFITNIDRKWLFMLMIWKMNLVKVECLLCGGYNAKRRTWI